MGGLEKGPSKTLRARTIKNDTQSRGWGLRHRGVPRRKGGKGGGGGGKLEAVYDGNDESVRVLGGNSKVTHCH